MVYWRLHMAPLMESASAPSAQSADARDLLQQNRFSAKQAQANPLTLQFPVSQSAQAMATKAESGLNMAGQFNSQQQRNRITAGIGAPIDASDFNSNWNVSSDEQQTLDDFRDDMVDNQQASRMDGYSQAKAQSRETSLRSAMAQKMNDSAQDKLMQEVINIIPGAVGDIDTPLETGGILLGSSTATALYQLTATVFDGMAKEIDASPIGKYVPKGFDTKTILGIAGLINAMFIVAWSTVGLMIALLPVFIIIIIIGVATELIPGF